MVRSHDPPTLACRVFLLMNTASASERSSLIEGSTIADYLLVARLGEGGMGVVFKAEDTKLRRMVALKLLHPNVAQDPEKRRRFLREGRLAAHLTHPCIAAVYQVGEADGRIFIAMELCEGKSLKHVLSEQPILPYTEALHLFREITRGLRKAHEAGIIHRDLKPDNVMVEGDGIVKILDFGVAKPTEDIDANFTDLRTQHGAMVGTPAYMSPEQATGKNVDARSDIFSLGVVLYELLSGRRPFLGETWQDIIIAISRDPMVPVSSLRPDLPREVDAVLERCLTKRPEDRYASCRELLADVDRLQASAGMFRSGIMTAGTSLVPPPPFTDTGSNPRVVPPDTSSQPAVSSPVPFAPGPPSMHATGPGQRSPGARRTALVLGSVLLVAGVGAGIGALAGRVNGGERVDGEAMVGSVGSPARPPADLMPTAVPSEPSTTEGSAVPAGSPSAAPSTQMEGASPSIAGTEAAPPAAVTTPGEPSANGRGKVTRPSATSASTPPPASARPPSAPATHAPTSPSAKPRNEILGF
ncbi:serine/threonine-protein kinase [Chondromyces crocatus]|uniref:non-specific serine/threonine protein kinase n=1 Tax=Chondromyces crocatus TaxID=52 RepID=A0A0K1ELV4_CHOCO|nr:serine/threonine-protein kinase [Chondromyces crocatus]AKT41844.1 uncharacterized protein CMC5_060550 [Chondromyces crocatus]